jgi:hypothetical protein
MELMNFPSETSRKINISELQVGDILINLGEVLEVISVEDRFSLVISRMNEKQVLHFNADCQVTIKF